MHPGYTKILSHPKVIKSIAVDPKNCRVFYLADKVYSYTKHSLERLTSIYEYSSIFYTPEYMLCLGGQNGNLLSFINPDNFNEDPIHVLEHIIDDYERFQVNSIIQQDSSIYFTTIDRVIKVNSVSATTTNIAGNITKSVSTGDSCGSRLRSKFSGLRGLAIHNESFYLCDYGNNKLKVLKDDIISNYEISSILPDGTLCPLSFANGFTQVGFTHMGNMVLTNHHFLLIIDTPTHIILIKQTFGEKLLTSMTVSPTGEIYIALREYSTRICTIYQVNLNWYIHRLLWIAWIKNNSNECPLSSLPKEIIKEICSHLLF